MPNLRENNLMSDESSRTFRLIVIVIIAGLITLGWFLWSKVYESPSNVFWGMVSNNLATGGFVKELNESGGPTVSQTVEISTGASNTAHSFETLSQGGNTVKTEEINTPTEDYVRYLSIATSSGKRLNLKPIIGVWSKENATQTTNVSQLFSQSLLGIFPIGNLTSDQRVALDKQIKSSKVYTPDLSKVKRSTINGRLAYTYSVSVKPVQYVEMLQTFSKDTGLTALDNVKPQNYSTASPVTFTVSVDASSRAPISINYPGAAEQETYLAFGIVKPKVSLPTNTISFSDLQNRLKSIQ